MRACGERSAARRPVVGLGQGPPRILLLRLRNRFDASGWRVLLLVGPGGPNQECAATDHKQCGESEIQQAAAAHLIFDLGRVEFGQKGRVLGAGDLSGGSGGLSRVSAAHGRGRGVPESENWRRRWCQRRWGACWGSSAGGSRSGGGCWGRAQRVGGPGCNGHAHGGYGGPGGRDLVIKPGEVVGDKRALAAEFRESVLLHGVELCWWRAGCNYQAGAASTSATFSGLSQSSPDETARRAPPHRNASLILTDVGRPQRGREVRHRVPGRQRPSAHLPGRPRSRCLPALCGSTSWWGRT